MSRNRLYGLLALMCAAGYAWIYYNLGNGAETPVHACVVKKIAGIPCPSCGSTRSVISLMEGNVVEAVLWNPIGLILLVGMAVFPVWITYDLFNKQQTLYLAYRRTEAFFSRRRYAISALILVLANWLWNIYKGV